MRPLPALALALCLVLAGCSFGFQNGSPTETGTGSAAEARSTAPPGALAPPDPDSDVLGWEDGRWANESLSLTRSDGLNESEQRALVARAMARVETIRKLEFQRRVPVEVISRAEYRNRSLPGAPNGSQPAAFRVFDNAKFEALFLVGEDSNSLDVQEQNRGASVKGFYSPRTNNITIISDSGNATIDELTLGHELVHALQDQRFGLNRTAGTREEYNAHNGLIEGDAQFVQQLYERRCGESWRCLTPEQGRTEGGAGGQTDLHLGIFTLNYFPYADGPGFVQHFRQRGGWDRVNALYDDLPASTEQVINPELYGRDQPANVTVTDSASNGWERVRPPAPGPRSVRPDYAGLGQSGLVAMFAYTLYDSYNRSAVVSARAFLEGEGRNVNRTDPFNYSLPAADGWDGDRLHVYQKGGETGYVWKLVWDSPAEAREFAAAYRDLLGHWDGERVGENTFRIDEGPYADAFSVRVQGDTVTIVNAPTVDALSAVHGGAR